MIDEQQNSIEFTIINWEYLWSEYNAGLLNISELAVDGRRDAWNAIPNELRERWLQSYARFYDPNFIEWMKEKKLLSGLIRRLKRDG